MDYMQINVVNSGSIVNGDTHKRILTRTEHVCATCGKGKFDRR